MNSEVYVLNKETYFSNVFSFPNKCKMSKFFKRSIVKTIFEAKCVGYSGKWTCIPKLLLDPALGEVSQHWIHDLVNLFTHILHSKWVSIKYVVLVGGGGEL